MNATRTKYLDDRWIRLRVWQGWRVCLVRGLYYLSSEQDNNLHTHLQSRRLQYSINYSVVAALAEKGDLYWYTPHVAALHPQYVADKFMALYHLRNGVRPVHVRNYSRTPKGRRILSRIERFYDPLL